MRKRVKVPFIDNVGDVPFVRFNLDNGNEGYALIDTGSESTIFDLYFVKENKNKFKVHKTRKKINFVGISKGNEQPIVNVSTSVRFSDEDLLFRAEGLLSDLSYVKDHLKTNYEIDLVAIFGSDFLQSVNADVNFQEKVLYVEDDIPCQQ